MKVLFPLVKCDSGTDVWTYSLAQALPRHGIETEVCEVAHVCQYAPNLARWLNNLPDTDIVHANSWNGFAFRQPGKAFVVTVHHLVHSVCAADVRPYRQRLFHRLLYQYEKKSCEKASVVTVPSRYTCLELHRLFGVNAVVVPNGIDTSTFRPDLSTNHLSVRADHKKRLLFVGNLTKRKGADLLIQILDLLPEDFVLFVRANRGEVKLSKQHPRIKHLPPLKTAELVAYYNYCHALLAPSRLEGFGLAVAEAMACARPVIATNFSSIPELIIDGMGGYLCEAANPDSFADAISRLFQSHDNLTKFGIFNRERVIKQFSVNFMVEAYLHLYKRLLDQHVE